ncbi:PREDICTED: uncharacterized protein LOC109481200 [Branchiostoma belcheri]|uniref:Uncharacterized protein LOC109481200 n=1 Tax=Branchiostoma belcheri TaxID=7741 RepID=A0A6P5ABW5_BRABE|nr:PREDICTED: uncharacterized protein LOC109481200 [Branchiostoma belcheri]
MEADDYTGHILDEHQEICVLINKLRKAASEDQSRPKKKAQTEKSVHQRAMDHFLNFRPTPGIMTIDEEHHEILRLVSELKKMCRSYDSALTPERPTEEDVWKLRSDDPMDDDDPGPGYEKIRERRRPLYDTVKLPKEDLCHHCNEPVSEQGLSLFSKTWCEDHLFCAFCNDELSLEFLFLEIDLRPVCARCYMVAEKGRGGRGEVKKSSTLERMKSTGSASGVKRSNSLVRSFRKNAKKVHLPGTLLRSGQESEEVAIGEVNPLSDDEFLWRESDG